MKKSLRIEVPWFLPKQQNFHYRPKMPKSAFAIVILSIIIFWIFSKAFGLNSESPSISFCFVINFVKIIRCMFDQSFLHTSAGKHRCASATFFYYSLHFGWWNWCFITTNILHQQYKDFFHSDCVVVDFQGADSLQDDKKIQNLQTHRCSSHIVLNKIQSSLFLMKFIIWKVPNFAIFLLYSNFLNKLDEF